MLQDPLSLVVRLYEKVEGLIVVIVRPIWRILQGGWTYVKPTRFSAFTILAGAILLLLTDQGRELAARFSDDIGFASEVILLLSVGWLALQSWYWARVSLYFEYGMHRSDWPSAWVSIMPRLYAGAVFLVAAGALLLAGNHREAAFIAVAGALFVPVLIYRTRIFAALLAGTRQGEAVLSRPQGFLELPTITVVALVGSALIALTALVVISIWPVPIGQMLGATSAAFFAFGNLIPIGSFLITRSREFGYPMIVTLFVWALLISPLADNHEVPTMGKVRIAKNDDRLTVEAALEAWLKAQGGPSSEALPIVFVSTAGGGLRAAYWTATVLGQIQDTCPEFATKTFSISGVSGGSVGAAFFAARRASRATADKNGCLDDPVENGDKAFMQTALSGDFLGPTVAALLFPDLLQRFLPYPFLPDRGTALADAWQAGWDAACAGLAACAGKENGLGGAFLSKGPPQDGATWRPILMLNGTHQETGKRLIASHVQVTRDTFFDAFDVHYLLEKDLSLATAALNSARFTYVSPAGRLVSARDGKDMGHVLDGGYFENYGAVTTNELILKVADITRRLKQKIRPIIIQIASDPDLKQSDYPIPNEGFLKLETKPHFFANEIAGPILGLMRTRSARGVLASKSVAELVSRINSANTDETPFIERAVFTHFQLCPDEGASKPPLGWAMSRSTRDQIDKMLMEAKQRCNNPEQFRRLIEALGAKAPSPQ